ncbi:MAG: GIY-YIG nuclease family protein, partial [Sphingomonas sp.]|nr:GIY-YIG nuclease family protein [Sphingomonas sp.]
SKLEHMLHRVFVETRLDVGLRDRFDQAVQPREWFLVPLHVIDEVIERFKDGSIVDFRYDRDTAQLVRD